MNPPINDNEPSVGDNPTFVRLIQVAREDREMRDVLVNILSLDDFNRKSSLNSLIEEMKMKSAPPDFIEAIACLRDQDVAEQALKLFEEQ